MTRIFLYSSASIDDAFKQAAKKSLQQAGWNPIAEFDGPIQSLECSGSDRSTCVSRAEGGYAIVAQREQ
jgi:hypothetical protein